MKGIFEKYTGKCGMRLKNNNRTFINSCKHRFLGNCFKRLHCPCKITDINSSKLNAKRRNEERVNVVVVQKRNLYESEIKY